MTVRMGMAQYCMGDFHLLGPKASGAQRRPVGDGEEPEANLTLAQAPVGVLRFAISYWGGRVASAVAQWRPSDPLRLSVNRAPVAQWIEQLTSDYLGRCAVAPSVGGGA